MESGCVSSVRVATKFTYTYVVRCAFIPGDEARGIACSIEFHHAAIQKLERRLGSTRPPPKWHFPRRARFRHWCAYIRGSTERRESSFDSGFPPRAGRTEEWSVSCISAKSCYCVAWETGLPTARRRSSDATVFAREVGPNPNVHSDKTYNLELNIRSDVGMM